MLVRKGETKQDKYMSGTYDGIYINANLIASAANTAISVNDFKPSEVSVKVILSRGGQKHTIMQDNLMILGTFSAYQNGLHEFIEGIDKQIHASGVYAKKLRTVFLAFGGHIRIADSDTLLIEVIASNSCVTSAISSDFTIDFYANPSIGYEYSIPEIRSEVVQANTTSQPFSPGNNVTELYFLNFDKNTLVDEVITSVSLNSDRLDKSFDFNALLAEQHKYYGDTRLERYGSVLPISASDTTGRVFRGLPYYPQSFILFDGKSIQNELDNCRINFSFNGANVAASQNYVVWRTYQSTIEQIQKAVEREDKHKGEKIQSLPTA